MNNLVTFSNGVLSVSNDASKATAPLPTFNPTLEEIDDAKVEGEKLLNPESQSEADEADAGVSDADKAAAEKAEAAKAAADKAAADAKK